MKGFVATSTAAAAADAGKEVAGKIKAGIEGAKVAMAYGSCDYDSKELLAAIAAELPGVPVLGNTSFTGIIAPEGFVGGDTPFVGILALGGDDVVIGVEVLLTHGTFISDIVHIFLLIILVIIL